MTARSHGAGGGTRCDAAARHGHHTLRRALFLGAFFSIAATAVTVLAIMALTWRAEERRGAHRRQVRADGVVEYCYADVDMHVPWRGALATGAAVLVVWGITGALARRVARPLSQLAEVARRIGAGDLRARPVRAPSGLVEVHALAEALGDMAERIEKQIADQRALLAGVSHELRTPLGHLRILVDTQRERPSPATLDQIEREVIEMDALVGTLLAQARLDFSVAERRDVDLVALAKRGLERAGLDAALLRAPAELKVAADPTLLLGALGNLLDNAAAHGGGARAIVVQAIEGGARLAVEDQGPGIPQADRAKVFEPFFHRGAAGSLGLGLHLVRRIAVAHGGGAFVEDRAGGGARVGFTVRG
ncbi:MAG: hypothetical protein A2138_04615 [Deltaproteobacteria bacterium RBG_16_71_12]|nr:MAG: hypothetical protein A2138_04615 [Deltaproteobacteria bacterium RBG_16_71_12]